MSLKYKMMMYWFAYNQCLLINISIIIWIIDVIKSILHRIDDVLKQAEVVGVKVIESVLNGTNYGRSLKAILILANSFQSLKWEAFLEHCECEICKLSCLTFK